MRVTFQEVKVKGVRRWIDPKTGKQRQETKWFSQTINPFNKNSAGEVKTREEISREINQQRADWLGRDQP